MINSSFVFFGSPKFAKIILEKLEENNIIPSVLICNPDKPFGRKKTITPPLTKELVIKKNLPIKIFQPESKEDLVKLFKSGEIPKNKFAIVAAYSKIIPKEVIDFFPLGIIGVHPSLLPKYRGASPIQGAILNGDKIFGTSIFLIDEKTDHGPILAQETMDLSDKLPNYEELEEKLAFASANLLIRNLPLFAENKITPRPQNEFDAVYTKKFETGDGFVDLQKDNPEIIFRKIKSLNPEPGVYSIINNKRIKLIEAEKISDNYFLITKIQPEGKKIQPANLKLPLN